MSTLKLLYRPDEVAAALSLSKAKVYELIKDGELVAHCHNGPGKKPVMVIADSVVEYVARHKVDPEEWKE